MQITVFGATGKVGRQVVSQALARGYSVRAFCHSNPSFSTHPDLQIVRGDIHDAMTVQQAVAGADAVISCLGSWHTKTKDIVSSGVRAIIPAMQTEQVSRIISLTGSEARDAGDSFTLIHRLMHAFISVVGGKVLRDGEGHIKALRESNLDWTVIRSPIMTSQTNISYLLNAQRPLPWKTIHRSAVVEAMLDQLEDSSHLRESPYIHNA